MLSIDYPESTFACKLCPTPLHKHLIFIHYKDDQIILAHVKL